MPIALYLYNSGFGSASLVRLTIVPAKNPRSKPEANPGKMLVWMGNPLLHI